MIVLKLWHEKLIYNEIGKNLILEVGPLDIHL